MATMKLQGVDFVQNMLAQLAPIPAKRVARNALNAAARIIRDQTKANLNAHGTVDTGLLRDTLVIYQKGANASKVVVTLRASGKLYTVQRKDKRTGKIAKPTRARPSKYFHLVEYGTEHSRAEPSLRPAIEQKKGEAIQAIIDGAAKSLIREANRLGAKAK